jgi:hypothetical protein
MGQLVTEATVEGAVGDAWLAFVQPSRELARRVTGGLEIILYWRADDNSTSVQIRQGESDDALLFAVAPEHALDAFYHPFAHLPAGPEERP